MNINPSLKIEAHFYNNIEKWNKLAGQTSNIDHFCSSFAWIEPSFRVFNKGTHLFISEIEKNALILCQGINHKIGRYYIPLESSWELASPFLGKNVEQKICALLAPFFHMKWDVIYLSGLPFGSSFLLRIKKCVSKIKNISIRNGKLTHRFIASLEDGIEGFYARRSRKFRRNMRKNKEKTSDIRFQIYKINSSFEMLSYFNRAVDIEKRSWKGLKIDGIISPRMNLFSKRVLLHAANQMSACGIIAFDGTKEVGFLYGALFKNIFRGLQMSYDNNYRDLGLGNMLQHKMIEYLANNQIKAYDLGSEIPYKTRWAEIKLTTQSILIRRR